MKNNNIKLSICTITYNHEKFIKKAIGSFLIQKTNFDIEIVIGDDHSSDNTSKILKEYKKKYPSLINLKTNKKNQGMQKNFAETLKRCKGEYIALCEGDDYWTDPLKLQKQVDFLEKNPEYSGCFHDTYLKKGDNISLWRHYYKEDFSIIDTISTLALFHTSSFLFRNNIIIPNGFKKIVSGDMALFSIVAYKGMLKRIPEVMSVYRHHNGGITKNKSIIDNFNQDRIKLWNFLNKHFNYRYDKEIQNIIKTHKKNLNKC